MQAIKTPFQAGVVQSSCFALQPGFGAACYFPALEPATLCFLHHRLPSLQSGFTLHYCCSSANWGVADQGAALRTGTGVCCTTLGTPACQCWHCQTCALTDTARHLSPLSRLLCVARRSQILSFQDSCYLRRLLGLIFML